MSTDLNGDETGWNCGETNLNCDGTDLNYDGTSPNFGRTSLFFVSSSRLSGPAAWWRCSATQFEIACCGVSHRLSLARGPLGLKI